MKKPCKLMSPRIPKKKLNYVDLWMYFEERGAEVKNTMLAVMTWIIGFAAAVLGFVFKETISFKNDTISVHQPMLMILLSFVGIAITYYANVLLNDFGEHINRNFDRADLSREGDKSLDELWEAANGSKADLPQIWKRIRVVALFFGGFFFRALTWSTRNPLLMIDTRLVRYLTLRKSSLAQYSHMCPAKKQ